MDKLIYKSGNTTIEKDVTDMSSKDLMQEFIELMQILGYDNENIEKALDNVTL